MSVDFDVRGQHEINFNDGFVYYKHVMIFSSQGLELCGLLWCFYQLFGLSFWRHPFTAEDPLVSKWCNATFLQICSQIFIFELPISLMVVYI